VGGEFSCRHYNNMGIPRIRGFHEFNKTMIKLKS